jgi:hypothetical protein
LGASAGGRALNRRRRLAAAGRASPAPCSEQNAGHLAFQIASVEASNRSALIKCDLQAGICTEQEGESKSLWGSMRTRPSRLGGSLVSNRACNVAYGSEPDITRATIIESRVAWLTETVLHGVMRRAAVPRTQFRRGRVINVAWGRRMVHVAWGWRVVHAGRRWRRVISGGWRRRIPKIRRRGLRWKLRSYRGGQSNSQCANSAEREDGFCCGPHGVALSM